jgi:hypothetical protein
LEKRERLAAPAAEMLKRSFSYEHEASGAEIVDPHWSTDPASCQQDFIQSAIQVVCDSDAIY